jgi:hypothetical protein
MGSSVFSSYDTSVKRVKVWCVGGRRASQMSCGGKIVGSEEVRLLYRTYTMAGRDWRRHSPMEWIGRCEWMTRGLLSAYRKPLPLIDTRPAYRNSLPLILPHGCIM